MSGFEVLTVPAGLWPKVHHKDTGLQVDILPEGARPGTTNRPAPTTIRPPATMGGQPGSLLYLPLPELVEIELAAGRARDDSDVIELLRANWDQKEPIRRQLTTIHQGHVEAFDRLVEKARDQ